MTVSAFIQQASSISREAYDGLRRAVELGRWPDGRRLSAEQRQTCLQAIIAWEASHVPEHQRSGYIDKPGCATTSDAEQPVNWRQHNATDSDGETNA